MMLGHFVRLSVVAWQKGGWDLAPVLGGHSNKELPAEVRSEDS